MPACLLLSKMGKKEELRQRCILHVTALHSSSTHSLASGQWCWPDGTWLWEDRSVTAGGQISCCRPWVNLRGHMPSCSPGRQCPRAPLQGGKGAGLSVPSHPAFSASPHPSPGPEQPGLLCKQHSLAELPGRILSPFGGYNINRLPEARSVGGLDYFRAR